MGTYEDNLWCIYGVIFVQILPQIMHQNSTDIRIKITHISCVKFMVHFFTRNIHKK